MRRAKQAIHRSRSALTRFLATEASGGIVVLIATSVAFTWANFASGYESFWNTHLQIADLDLDLRHWVNDALMAIFFLVVGLEIKRELVVGELRTLRVAALPLLGAVGGMLLPALLYLSVNGSGEASHGWAIPIATDIAFVVGGIALLGTRVPDGLRLFLLTLAIVDDIGAIVVIAVFYSAGLALTWAAAILGALTAILILRALRVRHVLTYLAPGLCLWFATWKLGVHPTLAGVALGLLVPARPIRGHAVLESLEARLHPISSFLVIPIFALANAGIVVDSDVLRAITTSRLFWGIVLGLVVGKSLGIFAAARLGERLRLGLRPAGVAWNHIAGGATLSGIGFTVSLFIAGLAFESAELVTEAKIGILMGSLSSAVLGGAVLLVANRARSAP